VWSDAQEVAWKEDCGRRVDEEVNAYLAVEPPPLGDMFDFTYAELPLDLLAQRSDVLAGGPR
jgi:2-oxoisovalerate dehydrogenase E1 component alpha subunit